jgi:hypothetical protein
MELNTEWLATHLARAEQPQAMAMVFYRADPTRQSSQPESSS